MHPIPRRTFLQHAAATVALATPLGRARAAFTPDLVLKLTARPDALRLFGGGGSTRVLRYRATVLAGRADAVRPLGTSYLGPILELRRGERVRIHFDNTLDERSIVHWHGLIVSEHADGHPRFAVEPGGRYTYDFTVRNPAGTYLYHPHPHGRTGFQMYHGLAGLIVVRDAEDEASGLPRGPHDLPLVIQDRRVDSDDQLVFSAGMMDRMSGVLGDTVLVNGRPDARFAVARGRYRLRIVNASNARIYKLAWSDGRPFSVVGTDNGLLDAATGAQTRPYLMLGPTERVEVLEDFARRPAGAEVALASQPFDPGSRMVMMMGAEGRGGMRGMMEGMRGMMEGMGGMMDGMMGRMGRRGRSGRMGMMGSSQGDELPIARFTVGPERGDAGQDVKLPPALPASGDPRFEMRTELGFRHMRGLLNGRTFEMETVAAGERVPLGAPLVWTFEHDVGMGMRMPHPMHLHGVRFRVVRRERLPGAPDGVAEGYVDEGFKDSVLVFPGERVQLALNPTEPGLFLYHCHNLEHEDGGMMRNYRVEV